MDLSCVESCFSTSLSVPHTLRFYLLFAGPNSSWFGLGKDYGTPDRRVGGGGGTPGGLQEIGDELACNPISPPEAEIQKIAPVITTHINNISRLRTLMTNVGQANHRSVITPPCRIHV